MSDEPVPEEELREIRTAHHEAAHALAAYKFRRPIRLVSIRPGETFAGIMVQARSAPLDLAGFRPELPGIVQPAGFRRRIEREICVSLAGDFGASLVSMMQSGYASQSEDERNAAAAALEYHGVPRRAAERMAELEVAALSRSDVEYLAALERDPTPLPHDERQARDAAWALAGDEGWALLNYLRHITKQIVWGYRDSIGALADELLERKVVSGRRVRDLMRERAVEQWH